jgi:hypothetical protein
VSEQVLEAEVIEEPASEEEAGLSEERPLPVPAGARSELDAWRGEVRIAALAAAGGLVAGVATVAALNAVRGASSLGRPRAFRRKGRRERVANVVASRSFLIDVHVLGR